MSPSCYIRWKAAMHSGAVFLSCCSRIHHGLYTGDFRPFCHGIVETNRSLLAPGTELFRGRWALRTEMDAVFFPPLFYRDSCSGGWNEGSRVGCFASPRWLFVYVIGVHSYVFHFLYHWALPAWVHQVITEIKNMKNFFFFSLSALSSNELFRRQYQNEIAKLLSLRFLSSNMILHSKWSVQKYFSFDALDVTQNG